MSTKKAAALLTILSGLTCVPWAFAAPSRPDAPQLSTTTLRARVATAVTVTSTLRDRNVIPGSVQLHRIDSAGRASVVGVLHDDGLEGDSRAGDGIWSLRTVLNETGDEAAGLRISAAVRGNIFRTISAVTPLRVVGGNSGRAALSPRLTAPRPDVTANNTTLLNYEGFNDGAILTNQYPGITFANATVLQSGVSLNEFEFPPHSGANVVVDTGGAMTITLSTPIGGFSAFFTYSVPLTIKGFDSNNNQVASATSHFSNNMAISGAAGTSPNDSIQLISSTAMSKITITGAQMGSSFAMDDTVLSPVGATPPPVTPPTPVGPPPLQITSSSNLGAVAAGGSLNATLTATGGTPPYKWAATGLPAGISVSADGKVAGTPTGTGQSSFTVSVTDTQPLTVFSPVFFSVLAITTTSLPNATAFQPYSQNLAATGGTQPYSFSATGLPPGTTMSSNGTIAGTPTKQGTYAVTVRVTESGGVAATASLSLTVNAPLPLAVPSATLAAGITGTHYSQVLTATGGAPPYTWSVASGTVPPGTGVIPAGTLNGTPSQAGTYTFVAVATDSTGGSARGTITVTVNPPALTLSVPSSLPSGMVNIEYPSQVITASGGVPPYTFSSSGSLPAGVTLGSDGTLHGTPGSAGTSSFTIKATDSATPAATATAAAQITVRATATDLTLSTGSVSFAAIAGSSAVPPAQTIRVQSTVPANRLTWSAAMNPSVPWLNLSTSGTSTPGLVNVALTSQALALAPSNTPYQTTITITCSCGTPAQNVTVSLNLSKPPALLTVLTNLLAFSGSSTGASVSQNLSVQNTGGDSVGIASIQSAAPWIQVGVYPSAIPGGPATSIPVTANSGGLSTGFYRSNITISSSTGVSIVPVTLLVADNPTMVLAPAGQQVLMASGGVPGPFNNSVSVSVSTASSISWTASVLPGASWLTLGASSGSSTSAAPGAFTYSIDPGVSAGLAAGTYYGTIRVTSAQVADSPLDFQVALTVAAATTSQVPNPSPQGLLFIGPASATLPGQTVQVSSGGSASVNWQASAGTNDGGSWLSVTPLTGTATSSAASQTTIAVNTTGLANGAYYGTVNYAGSGAAIRTVNITLIVSANAPVGSERKEISRAASACSASQTVPARIEPVSGFSATVGLPTPISLRILTNCGDPVTNASVAASVSNGDSPFSLQLANAGTGLYTGTWTPRHSATQVALSVSAAAAGLTSSVADFQGTVVPGGNPLIVPQGALHVYYPQSGSAVAPGTIVQIYGTNFSTQTAPATALPLPTSLGGTSVIIGGIPAPLYYVSPGQINAQVPFELQANGTYQVIVNSNGALSVPESLGVAALAPGIAVNPTGTLIAQHLDGTLVTSATPAQPGEYVVIYGTGFGSTSPSVSTGAASPSSPLGQAQSAATVTLNGEAASVLFTGLTPGLAGLYQVDFQVPADAPNGDLVLALSQNGVAANSGTLSVHN